MNDDIHHIFHTENNQSLKEMGDTMNHVIFFEDNDLLLSQIRDVVPQEEEGIKLKGRKGKVLTVKNKYRNVYHVEVELMKKKQEG
ncbi:hypothetical protein [Evansella cellulosilytica]|uniref:Uncharacterized protein n=1 Tax=Evansella cellulosilytica (strain ATCC 21833 / DSM 2522 / FERM P-1141 / JCM 9156 / N-4) TaxID=649639 RepID=E6TYD0_EVAC2|nr:hypothetical protein [Evansella cellulosilytica]ADU28868.1 hypothetical protein Bcell_0586 [Evansella cellulosilytica DSM 2522]